MKRLYVLLISVMVMLFSFGSAYAYQVAKATTKDILKEKSWSLIFPSPKDYEYTTHFTQDTITACLIYEETIVLKYEYYLSDNPVTVFDSTRIGKNTSGKYIIQRENNKMSVLKIVTLTPNYLKLQNMKDGNIMEFKRKED